MDVTCAGCGATVFTIAGWSDLDHCPACGRRLAVGSPLDEVEPVMGLGREDGRNLFEGPFEPRVERRLGDADPLGANDAAMSLRLDECLDEARGAIAERFDWPVLGTPKDPRRSH